MKQLLLTLALASLLASCTSSNRISFLGPSATAPTARVNLAEYEKKYAKYDGVFLNSEQTIEHYGGKTSWSCMNVRKLRYLVLNADAEWLGTFNLDLPWGTSLENLYLTVTSPDGTMRTYGMSDLKVEKRADGGKSLKFAYPDIKRGSIVEEAYEMSLPVSPRPELDHDVQLQFSVPCERLSFRFAYPDWWRVQVKKIAESASPNYKETVDTENRKKIISYQGENIPAIESEPYAPYYKEFSNYMEFMITELEMDRRYRAISSWTQLASEFQRYAIAKESFWSGRMEETTQDLTDKATSDLEKIDSIVTYLQTNIKPGVGEADDNFADVLENRAGNVYLINGLARAMLEEAGLRSEILLIHSARDGYFDPNYISSDQFYIPAVAAYAGDELYVVFPYAKHIPVGFIPDYFQGQRAMRVSKDGFAGFMDVPQGRTSDNTIDDNYQLTIDEEGLITVEEERVLRGSNAFSMRAELDDVREEDMEDLMKELLSYSDGDVKLVSHQIINREDHRKPLVVKLKYTIDNLVTVTPEEVIFQTAGLFSPSTSGKWKVDTEERRNPIRIYFDERTNKNIRVTFPKSWSLTTELRDVHEENRFGAIKGSYRVSTGELHVEQSRQLKRSSSPKEAAADLLRVIGHKSKLHVPTLVFKKGEG